MPTPPKPQLTVTSVGPDNVGLTWTPVDLAEKYNLQHLDPKTDGVTKVDSYLWLKANAGR